VTGVPGVPAAMAGGTVTMTGGFQCGLRGRSSPPVRLPPTEIGFPILLTGLPTMPMPLMRPPPEGVIFVPPKPPTGPTPMEPMPPRCAAWAAVATANTAANAISASGTHRSEFGLGLLSFERMA